MESINFHFLNDSYPELAELGGFAEHYIHSDPSGALVKLRLFTEVMVKRLYDHNGLKRSEGDELKGSIDREDFKAAVPVSVIYKLHALRMNGNKGAHGGFAQLKPASVDWLLREAHQLAQWFYLFVNGGSQEELKDFSPINEKTFSDEQTGKSSAVLLDQLAEREKTISELLVKLDSAASEKATTILSYGPNKQLELKVAQANEAANALNFDEETTRRRLIDNLLAGVDWKVGATGKDTNEVYQEMELDGLGTETGKGWADYVLMDEVSGTPLAVIEAKRTVHDAQKGQHQAKDYANGLEKKYGVRPIIFYTNGYDIWIWNDAKNEPPRSLYGFYSKESLKKLHFQNKERAETLSQLGPDTKIVDRLYQFESIQRICEKFDGRRRKALLVQATGTGKTRVVVALSKLMMEANWARRILFLCDRRELRKQAKDVFVEFIPGATWTYIGRETHNEKNKRIYLGTYPAMIRCFENFDVGFFDLIIVDEAHRSIFNRYFDLFKYFDALRLVMCIAPPVVPEAKVVFEAGIAEPQHGAGQSVEILRPIRPNQAWSISCNVGSLPGSPPAIVLSKSPNNLPTVNVPTVVKRQPRRPFFRRHSPGQSQHNPNKYQSRNQSMRHSS
ncbi:MAG: DEAD/DEAH box helicase family protein [Candidatus Poribacteria bacterium]|nr:DEAD/DEAH box helicase family protein [Candidatus Poribacteria bacterium]